MYCNETLAFAQFHCKALHVTTHLWVQVLVNPKIMSNLAIASQVFATIFWKYKKRYAYLVSENVGNFRPSKDSIVVLTRIAWTAIVTSAQMVSYDLHLRRSIVGSRFL